MKPPIFAAALILALGTAGALAHGGVKNPAVKARMTSMEEMGASLKSLIGMAKGEAAFDAGRANAAFATIARESARTADLFAAQESDPKTEAKPSIWENYADFTAHADVVTKAASGVQVTSREELVGALGPVGLGCKSCHKLYRQK